MPDSPDHPAEARAPGPEEELERLAAEVADTSPVDWERESGEHPDLGRALERLQALERIGEAFRQGAAAWVDPPSDPAPGPASTTSRQRKEPLFRWGDLEVRDELGRGRWGVVYVAFDPHLQREVALKLCALPGPDSERALEEARLLAKVRHPHVLTVHGAAIHDGRVGLWTDRIEGASLESLLTERGPLSPEEATLVGLDVCAALAAVHGAGLVHGDVKASNVMRRVGGEVVLVDFGSGRRRPIGGPAQEPGGEPPGAGPFGSGPGGRTGTPLSMAPELLDGAVPSVASDVYAVGALLYRLVTGAHPVEADTLPQLRQRLEAGARVPLSARRPDASPVFAEVVERALQRDPRERFASAGELRQALAATLPADWARQAPAAPAATPRPRPAAAPAAAGEMRPVRPRWPVVLLPFLLAALVVGGWGVIARVRAPLQVEASLLRGPEGGGLSTPASAGVQVGDQLHLELNLNRTAHVYVLNEDGAGRVHVLFPLPEIRPDNPLSRGQHRLPGARNGVAQDWQVTRAGGGETVLVLASRRALPELERQVQSMPRARPDVDPDHALDPSTLARLRSIAGLRPAEDEPTPRPGWLASLAREYRQRERKDDDLWMREFRLSPR